MEACSTTTLLDVFDRTDGAPSRWPTIGIKLSAKETVVTTTFGVDDLATEAVACLRTLLDNADRYYVDQGRPPTRSSLIPPGSRPPTSA